jgi:hypothetical protein
MADARVESIDYKVVSEIVSASLCTKTVFVPFSGRAMPSTLPKSARPADAALWFAHWFKTQLLLNDNQLIHCVTLAWGRPESPGTPEGTWLTRRRPAT